MHILALIMCLTSLKVGSVGNQGSERPTRAHFDYSSGEAQIELHTRWCVFCTYPSFHFLFFKILKQFDPFVKTSFCLDIPDFSDAGRMITTSVTAKPSLKNGKQAVSSMGDRGSKAGSRTVSSVFNFYFVLQLHFLINTLILHFPIVHIDIIR